MEGFKPSVSAKGHVTFYDKIKDLKILFYRKSVVVDFSHRVLNETGLALAAVAKGCSYFVSKDKTMYLNEQLQVIQQPAFVVPYTYHGLGSVTQNYISMFINCPQFVLPAMYTRVIPTEVMDRIKSKKSIHLASEISAFIAEAMAIQGTGGYIGMFRSKRFADPKNYPLGAHQPRVGAVNIPAKIAKAGVYPSSNYTSGNRTERNALLSEGLGIGIPDFKHFYLFYPSRDNVLYLLEGKLPLPVKMLDLQQLNIDRDYNNYSSNPKFDDDQSRYHQHLVYFPAKTLYNTKIMANHGHYNRRVN